MEKITYKKSFSAKLVLAQETIPFYQGIMDLCATHKKVHTRLSFSKQTINFGKNKVGVIKIARKSISLHLALNPSDYDFEEYKSIKDASNTKQGEVYPLIINIKNKKNFRQALGLLETALANVGATALCVAPDIDYRDVFYVRSFETLLAQGLIKKYVRKLVDGKVVEVEEVVQTEPIKPIVKEIVPQYNVNFTAKLLYEATGKAKDLYIITSYSNWDPKKAVKMKANPDNTFTASMSFPKGTALEFKICRSANWKDVEKGIWKEEIVNHNYVIVDKDLEIEDLIYNFRKD